MARPRAREGAALRAALVEAVAAFDEAAIHRDAAARAARAAWRRVEEAGGRASRRAADALYAAEVADQEEVQARRAYRAAAARLRHAAGLMLLHELERSPAAHADALRSALGLAADARELEAARTAGDGHLTAAQVAQLLRR